MQNGGLGHVDQKRFDARRMKQIQRMRQVHDIFVTACVVLLPAVVVVGIIYLAILFTHYVNRRSLRILLNAVVNNAAHHLKARAHELWGTPAVLGTAFTLFYLTILFFNCDVPGVKPLLPGLGFFTVRADANYSFAVLLGILSTAICAMPDVLFIHASRIYA